MNLNWRLFGLVMTAAWIMSLQAYAHPEESIWNYLTTAQNVYLVKVTGTTAPSEPGPGAVAFVVTEVLRGEKSSKLNLKLGELPIAYPLNSEWILASVPIERVGMIGWRPGQMESQRDYVGIEMTGDDGWVPGKIIQVNGQPFLRDVFDLKFFNDAIFDTAPDGTKGMTMDHLKEFLIKHPYKPDPHEPSGP